VKQKVGKSVKKSVNAPAHFQTLSLLCKQISSEAATHTLLESRLFLQKNLKIARKKSEDFEYMKQHIPVILFFSFQR
jgi:hypothetical protein